MPKPLKNVLDALLPERRASLDRRFNARLDETWPAAPPALTPSQIVSLRRKSRVDRPAFARSLGVSENTVKQWENGAKKPRGIALKLLAVVLKHGLEVLS
jgi:putative transcriptional regulator